MIWILKSVISSGLKAAGFLLPFFGRTISKVEKNVTKNQGALVVSGLLITLAIFKLYKQYQVSRSRFDLEKSPDYQRAQSIAKYVADGLGTSPNLKWYDITRFWESERAVTNMLAKHFDILPDIETAYYQHTGNSLKNDVDRLYNGRQKRYFYKKIYNIEI
ncbi:MAG: hypothetical protein ACQEQ0_08705 [Bacteroidota bacterium]